MKLIPSLPMPAWASGFKLVTYVCDLCEQPFATRHPSPHNIGIRMNDGWYCGRRCFTRAAASLISQLLAASTDTGNRTERMPLGLLIASRGLLSKAQLREVNNEQRVSGEEMGALLIRRGLVSEKQVAAARATQWGRPLYMVPREGARSTLQLPDALVHLYSAVPLHYGLAADELLVGFVHSIGYGLLYAIEHILGCKTQAGFVTPTDFEAQVKAQSETGARDSMFENLQTPLDMALALCQAAWDLEADEARVSKCRGFLWARVKRENNFRNLLFKTP